MELWQYAALADMVYVRSPLDQAIDLGTDIGADLARINVVNQLSELGYPEDYFQRSRDNYYCRNDAFVGTIVWW
jgi:hypothetical protein